MLSCREIVQLVTEYLEGAMRPESRLRFEEHVTICPPCRGFLSQMRATTRAARTIDEESLSPETRARLVAAFRGWSE
jgi:predicted anti-sigma-YlaC factor YlaD